jgi:6-phosphofructokinase 2
VVTELGGTASAVYLAGGEIGDRLRHLLDEAGIEEHAVPIAATTRESVHVRHGDDLYRFVLPGPEVGEAEWRALIDAVDGLLEADRVVVASGSLPPGVPDDLYARLARCAHERGAWLVLDTSGDELAAGAEEGVHVLRANRREMAGLVGADLDDPDDQERALADLVGRGAARIALMGLGAEGSLVVTGDGGWRVPAPRVEPISPVGAGDSLTGALALGVARGWPVERAAALGVAAGAAAVTTPRTELCRREDVERMVEGIEPRPLERA